jgi:hypothetical protein
MKFLSFALMLLVLTGCGMAQVKDKREARLMPEEVAKKVLSKYFGSDWVEHPYGISIHTSVCSGNYPMPIPSIEVVQNVEWNKNAINVMNWTLPAGMNPFPCRSVLSKSVQRAAPFTDEEINDIVDALVSLGAKIKEVKRN